MKRVFADTFYFIALLSRTDADHIKAVEWTRQYTGQLITTEWVLTELADGLASSKRRAMFAVTRDSLLANPTYRVIHLEMALHEEGIKLFSSRPDQAWSLTDCVSFVVMKRESIVEALTADHHFEQAGFVALLK